MPICLLLSGLSAVGQSGFYVPKQGKIHFSGDTATILSNVINQGNFGVGKKATVNFKGQVWQNDPSSKITDETSNGSGVAGQGGVVRFMGDAGRQRLIGGYNTAIKTGPVFSNLHLLNSSGLELAESNAKVWQEIRFGSGRLYLNNQVFVVGHQRPGKISGYDSVRYFVTGPQQNSSLLVREGIRSGDGLVTFPVGTTDFAYTPAGIRSKSARSDDYHVSVFDGARSGLTTGNSLADQGVNKTWQIGKRYFPGQDEVDVVLQHLNADEGPTFSVNRNKSYISQFVNNNWDEDGSQASPAPGYLTSSTTQARSGVNTRTLKQALSTVSYFTKLTGKGGTVPKTNLIFGAYRIGAYIVRVNWQTKPEVNVKKFVVERRRANEPAFVSVDTVRSLAPSGFSNVYLNYGINDSNSYRGISFYRLKIFDYSDSSYYSQIVGVWGVTLDTRINIWPNPTAGNFSVILSGNVAESILVHNSIGQLVWKEKVDGRYVVEVKAHYLTPGVYYVSVVGKDGERLSTEKLLVVR